MIIALDVGNTNIVFGIVKGDDVLFSARFATDQRKTEDEYAVFFKEILDLHQIDHQKIKGGIISSVVPPLTRILARAVTLVSGVTPMIVGPGVKTGLNILIDQPRQLGSDMVVDAVAALSLYQPPLIILDLGTASTMSVIDQKGNYIGSVIIPGIRISLDALASRTAQLPRVSLEAPEHVIGRNTVTAMQSGLIYGQASLIDGMIDRIEHELDMQTQIVATGGLSKIIIPHCTHDIHYDQDLLIRGLLLIYRRNM